MEEWGRKLLKDLQKSLERINVQAVGTAKIQESYLNQQQAKQQGKKELTAAKTILASSTDSLKEAVKGQFGKQITEVFEQQQQMMEKF